MNPQLLPRPARRRRPSLDPNGRRLPRREGAPLRIAANGRGLRKDALAVPQPDRIAGPGHAGPRPRLGARDPRLGSGAIGGDGRRPDCLPLELLPISDQDEHRHRQPVRRPRAAEDDPVPCPGSHGRAAPPAACGRPDTVAGRRDRALLLTFVLTGRRRAEVIGLTAGDISLEGDTAYYNYRGKGGKRGRRELPRPAYAALCATLADAGLDLVRWTR
jgi:hypothetical protein